MKNPKPNQTAQEKAERIIPPIEIFLAFLRLGMTSFGGPAMLAYIRELAVNKKGWISSESFRDGLAMCQIIPGATAMQVSAYVGLRVRGFRGSLAAYLGFGLPSFLLMLFLSYYYQQGHGIPQVGSLFRGLQVLVVALVANATISFGLITIKMLRDFLIAIIAAILFVIGINPILTIGLAAIAGMIFYPKKVDSTPIQISGEKESLWRSLRPAMWLILVLGLGVLVLYFVDTKLFELAILMLRVDTFAFGGGFSSLPLLLHEVVDIRHWMDSKTFMDGIALGQVTPGPIVITATFIGYQFDGFRGAIVGTVAIFSPSFIILTAAVPNFDRLRHSSLFKSAILGIMSAFVGLLLSASIKFGTAAEWTIASILLSVAALIALRLKVDVLWVFIVGAVLSVWLL